MRFSIEIAKKKFRNREITACEIGVLKAENALQILQQLNVKRIYLIDPYISYSNYAKDISSKNLESSKKEAHNRLKEYKDRTVWIEKHSSKAVCLIKEKLDFIYIDGNHFSPYIDNDIQNYYPLLKDGGVFSGHDYSEGWKDVIFAVNRYFKKKELRVKNRDWIIIK